MDVKIPIAQRMKAPREKVYAALQDPELVKRSIDGCERMTPTGPQTTEFEVKVAASGIKATWKGSLRRIDARPPDLLVLAVEGKAFPGSFKGSVRLQFEDGGGGTRITGEAEATVGGLIAAVGPRLIESGAQQIIADFLGRIDAQLTSSA